MLLRARRSPLLTLLLIAIFLVLLFIILNVANGLAFLKCKKKLCNTPLHHDKFLNCASVIAKFKKKKKKKKSGDLSFVKCMLYIYFYKTKRGNIDSLESAAFCMVFRRYYCLSCVCVCVCLRVRVCVCVCVRVPAHSPGSTSASLVRSSSSLCIFISEPNPAFFRPSY